jgi:Protein of unknown function (DUF3048) N-terminal domain/Protein of unknown function (DUF3048) C-terminal domain
MDPHDWHRGVVLRHPLAVPIDGSNDSSGKDGAPGVDDDGSAGTGGDDQPGHPGIVRRVRAVLSTPRGRIVAGLTALVVLIGGCVVATAGESESAAPTTTTTTTTTTAPPTTTTTKPPPPPPVYPLTGLPVADPAVAARPTLAVKIDNVEPESRPQIGLNQADIVYEERVEGAVTRFLALFHSHDSVPVGPVRSARTTDIGLYKPMGTPLFAWSGANAFFAERVRGSGIVDIGYDAAPGLYSRAGNRQAPHNLMLKGTPAVWANAYPGATPPNSQLFSYRAPGQPPTGGTPVKGMRIVFAVGPGSAPVEYVWNGTGWARFQNGTPHVDAEGVQIAPENVVISYTAYASSGVNDQFGVPIREAQLVGEGQAVVLTGGRAFAARWRKPAGHLPTQYFDQAGRPIGLTPGRTWVAVTEPGTTAYLPF